MALESERDRIRQASERLDEASLRRDFELYGQAGRPKFRDIFNAAMATPGLSVLERIARIVETEKGRAESVRRPTEGYRAAQAEYKEAWAALYTPEFLQKLEALKIGDPAGAEAAIAFLEADPWHFHSGYLKGKVAQYLRKVVLDAQQRQRIGVVILTILAKGKRQDLGQFASLARRIDSPTLRYDLERLGQSDDEGLDWRANFVLERCLMNDYRTDLRGAR